MQPKRTYGSQNRRETPSFISNSSDTSSSPERGGSDFFSLKRKRPLMDLLSNTAPPLKKPATILKKAKLNDKNGRHSAVKTKTVLRQMHLAIESSVIKTCSICNLSYTIGAPDDESLHRSHCARVQRGMEWGKEEEKELGMSDTDAFIVEEDIILSSKEKGRIVSVRANVGKKLGAKISTFLKTVNVALSAPDLPTEALSSSKVYMFLLRDSGNKREKIVGGVIAQRISTAMPIASSEDVESSKHNLDTLIHVEGNLYCKPEQLPTPLGIPRLFVSSAYRRKGIAQAVLSAAARSFIHGCPLDPKKGEVAFSQPTSMGRAVMERWGGGAVRVYAE